MHKRIVVFTSESVWLVERSEASAHVVGRASYGQHMPNEHEYAGEVYDPASIVVGGRMTFACQCGAGHTGWNNGAVTTGVITRVVEHSIRPARVVPEGYMDITPTWSGTLRLLVEVREWKGLQDMALAADRYVAAVDLGLITQGDLELIEVRRLS